MMPAAGSSGFRAVASMVTRSPHGSGDADGPLRRPGPPGPATEEPASASPIRSRSSVPPDRRPAGPCAPRTRVSRDHTPLDVADDDRGAVVDAAQLTLRADGLIEQLQVLERERQLLAERRRPQSRIWRSSPGSTCTPSSSNTPIVRRTPFRGAARNGAVLDHPARARAGAVGPLPLWRAHRRRARARPAARAPPWLDAASTSSRALRNRAATRRRVPTRAAARPKPARARAQGAWTPATNRHLPEHGDEPRDSRWRSDPRRGRARLERQATASTPSAALSATAASLMPTSTAPAGCSAADGTTVPRARPEQPSASRRRTRPVQTSRADKAQSMALSSRTGQQGPRAAGIRLWRRSSREGGRWCNQHAPQWTTPPRPARSGVRAASGPRRCRSGRAAASAA